MFLQLLITKFGETCLSSKKIALVACGAEAIVDVICPTLVILFLES